MQGEAKNNVTYKARLSNKVVDSWKTKLPGLKSAFQTTDS